MSKDTDSDQHEIECALDFVISACNKYEKCKKEHDEMERKKYRIYSVVPITKIVEFRREWLEDCRNADSAEMKKTNAYSELALCLQRFYDLILPEKIAITYRDYKIQFYDLGDSIRFLICNMVKKEEYLYVLNWHTSHPDNIPCSFSVPMLR